MQNAHRQTYLDWLRIIAILGVLFFHSARPFIPEDPWHIVDKEKSNMLLEFNFFLSRFRMPLLFFISGAVTYFMLQKRTAAQFIGLRFKRLLIPLLFGMLLIVPLQVYMERMEGGFKGNFFQFYPSVFTTGPYPNGNLSWHHLWFIAYLFVYDVVLAPLFKWLIVNKHRFYFLDYFSKGTRIYLLALPSVAAFSFTVLDFPETHDLVNDWCWNVYWLFFLLVGFACMYSSLLMESLERNRRISFTLAVVTIFAINYFRWNNIEPHDVLANYRTHWFTYCYIALYAFTAWLWVFTAIGYGKRYLNKKHSLLSYSNNAVYPFYILHQTVTVVLAYYVVKTPDTILMKYLFLVLVTFAICLCIYHLFIRPFALTRFLFGAKTKETNIAKQVHSQKREELATTIS